MISFPHLAYTGGMKVLEIIALAIGFGTAAATVALFINSVKQVSAILAG